MVMHVLSAVSCTPLFVPFVDVSHIVSKTLLTVHTISKYNCYDMDIQIHSITFEKELNSNICGSQIVVILINILN